jgi:hypothetical protein
MTNQYDKKNGRIKPVLQEKDMHQDLERIIQRAKDENEALENVLKNMAARRDQEDTSLLK